MGSDEKPVSRPWHSTMGLKGEITMRVRVLGGALAIVAIMLISSAAIAQYPTQSVGQGSSDIWVMNLDETEDANVVASYVDQEGNPDASVGSTIDPLGNTSLPPSA